MRATQVRNMREIDRRTFVKFGIGAWFAGCLPDWAGAAAEELKPTPTWRR